MSEAVETITKDLIFNKWTADELKLKMKDPQILAEINRVINQPDEDPQEVAQKELEAQQALEAEAAARVAEEEEQARVAQEAEVQRVAQEEAEKARTAEAAKPKEKIVVEYQVRDDKGNPIGKPTHLEADSWPEMSKKQQSAHENIVRYAERVKKIVLTPKQKEEIKKGLTDEEIIAAALDLEDKDPAKKVAAIRKITNADEREERERQDAVERENNRRDAVALKWMRGHLEDFNPCEANANAINAYITENGLDWTEDSLEAAFIALEGQLAPRVVREVSPAVDNPPAPAIQPEPPAAAPVSVTPAPPVAAPNTPAPAARKIPDGGLVPGQSVSGARPAVSKTAKFTYTKKDIKLMPIDDYKIRMRDPEFVKYVNTLYANG